MLNSVNLVGRLTRDPELRYTQNSHKASVTFNLAVEQDFTDQSGNRNADFPTCVIWGKGAENFTNLAHKGTMLSVTGRLGTYNYADKNNNRVYVTQVSVQSYNLIDNYGKGRQNNQANNNNGNYQGNQSNSYQNQPNGNYGANNQGRQNYQNNNNYGNNGQYQNQGNIDLSNLQFADDQGNYRG